MRKLLIAAVAAASFALATPALAQTEEETDPSTMEEQEAQQAPTTPDEATPPTVTGEPAAPMSPDASASAETTDEALESAENAQPSAAPTAPGQTQVATNEELPQEVQVAIADGEYTTDDLNRAQLQALQRG